MSILVTGGAGYIGSHTLLELQQAGYDVVVMDNLSNSKLESVRRVRQLTGKPCPFEQVDLLDSKGLDAIFSTYEIEGVIHFAGLKAVGESVEKPMLYYRNNVEGTLRLLEVMEKHEVRNMVFSSSATVYGDPHQVPVLESFPLSATNPYGRTKLMIEKILEDLYRSDDRWSVTLLRYFNPVGAHQSGEIGEDPRGIPNNLMPYVSQVAVGKLEELQVFGNGYPTRDGTGVRDYIHVVDLALGHVKAWEHQPSGGGLKVYNLGTGTGYSVLEIIEAFEKASGRNIPYRITDPRPGDVAEIFADPERAERELGWRAERDLETMCKDSWNWQQKNPQGF